MNLLKFKNRTLPSLPSSGDSANGKRRLFGNGRRQATAALPPVNIFIDGVVKSTEFLTYNDAETICEKVSNAIKQNRRVRLSFRNVKNMTTVFATVAIGNLYKKFPEKKIKALLEIIDISKEEMEYLEMTIETYRETIKLSRKQRRIEEAIINGDFI